MGYDLTVDMAIFRHTARRAHTQILWETVILVAHVHNHRTLTICHIFLERISSVNSTRVYGSACGSTPAQHGKISELRLSAYSASIHSRVEIRVVYTHFKEQKDVTDSMTGLKSSNSRKIGPSDTVLRFSLQWQCGSRIVLGATVETYLHTTRRIPQCSRCIQYWNS